MKPDKWSREVERLKKLPIDEVRDLWYCRSFEEDDGQTARSGSILFDHLVDPNGRECGCPVTIASRLAEGDPTPNVFPEIRRLIRRLVDDGELPLRSLDIEHRHLPVFAEIQRKHDKLRKKAVVAPAHLAGGRASRGRGAGIGRRSRRKSKREVS